MTRPLVVQVLGPKDSGKTTLVVGLIAAFRARGLAVAAVKHSHHDVPADHQGSDTWRMADAGAEVVALAGADGLLVRHRAPATAEAAIRATGDQVDVVVVEGFAPLAAAYIIRVEAGTPRRAALAHPDRHALYEGEVDDIEALVAHIMA